MPIEVRGRDEYKWEYGHYPRGIGFWSFKIASEIRDFHGSYSEAKKKALAYARKYHPQVFSIKVLK